MREELRENEKAREAGEKSERLLQDTYLSSGIGVYGTGPRLSASTLHGAKDDGIGAQVHENRSWKSRAIEEGDSSRESVASGGGLRATLRRWFGR